MAVIITKLSDLIRLQRLRSRAPVIVPFAIIAIAFAALGYRSWELSMRMERSLDSLAIQYLEYTAEITARRVDAAVQAEAYRTSEEWQQIERLSGGTPKLDAIAEWVDHNPWILSAFYVPDADPTSSLYYSRVGGSRTASDKLSTEFYTASGSVQYAYSPTLLIAGLDRGVFRQPVSRATRDWEKTDFREQVQVAVAGTRAAGRGLSRSATGLRVAVPLAPPLDAFAIVASLKIDLVQQGFARHRFVSLAFALAAIALLAIGAWLAVRGIRKENEATQLRAALVANVSHELRTPLAVIRLSAETLQRSDRLTPEQREGLRESILREVLHLSHLVENVLDVARLQKGAKRMAFAPVDPAELIDTVIDSYGAWIASRGFSVDLELDEDTDEQMWDRDSVQRALVNLIDNAIKYSGEKRTIHVALRSRGAEIEIEVADEGIGIHAQDIQRIFDPYYRAQFSDTETRRGAGLGLTLVQQIVQAHGGRVEVESHPGRGSSFRLVFPRRPPPQDAHAPGELDPA